jgi:mono/diheme cytochrome c family protein
MTVHRVTYIFALAFGLVAMFSVAPQAAAESLSVSVGAGEKKYTAAELLARRDATTITVPDDVSYRRAMTYRAVPLLALINGADPAFDTLEVRAADGFVSQIPLALVRKAADGGSSAWVAIEEPGKPWPDLPGRDASAGPFYAVWQHPERSRVGSEQWPYQTVAITAVESPAHRWPQISVDTALPPDAPARHGQQVFVTQCMPCHKMLGGGMADLGPDLGAPMNPTQYLTAGGLRALIRDPKSVRTWPQQQMPAFDETKLSDADLDAVIAYLAHMAGR